MAVHDRLGLPGRAGGEQHVQRVVERHRLELQGAPASASSEVRPGDCALEGCADRTARARRAEGTGSGSGSRQPRCGGRPACRRRCIPPPRTSSLARSERICRRRCEHRTPGRSWPRSRPGSRWQGRPRAPRDSWAGSRRPDRHAGRRACSGRREPGVPAPRAHRRSAARAAASASTRSRQSYRHLRARRSSALRSSEWRPGTNVCPA